MWPANSPDLNPVDYQIWGKLHKRVYRSQIRDAEQLKSRLIEEWEHFHQAVLVCISNTSIDTSIWNTYLKYLFVFPILYLKYMLMLAYLFAI